MVFGDPEALADAKYEDRIRKRIRFKLVLASNVATATPRLIAWSLEAVARMQSKFSYACTFKVADNLELLDNTKESTAAATILAQLDTWAETATPLTMTTVDANAASKTVFVEPTEYRQTKWELGPQGAEQVYIGTFRAIEA